MNYLMVLVMLAFSTGCQSPLTKESKSKSDEKERIRQAVAQPMPQSLDEAINSPIRKIENKARDQYRHPLETLQFFGLRKNMTVVEIAPGSGWYTEILAPFLMGHGTFYAAISASSGSTGFEPSIIDFAPEGMIRKTVFQLPEQIEIAPAGSADLVLTFRNVHNWIKAGTEQQAFNAFAKALKKGGILGVVEHRGDANWSLEKDMKSGYVSEDYVINLAKKAGFKLVAKSEINANPMDSKHYPNGVWTLPPTLKTDSLSRDHYQKIGESDRMTLKFIKVVN